MKRKTSSPIVNIVCTLLFVVFAFLYLFCFQGDLMKYAQHVLSEGMTVYNPLVGALIITPLLGVLSLISARFLTQNLFFIPAIYHLPSILVLASMTDINIVEGSNEAVYGKTWIVSIVVFALLLFVNRLVKDIPIKGNYTAGADVLRNLVLNLAVFLGMMTYLLSMANTSEMDHITLHQEELIDQGRYEEAALIGKKQSIASPHLTTLRAYALSRTNGIGEYFFEYPIEGNSDALLPSSDNPMLLAPERPIFKFVGGRPAEGISSKLCLQLLNWRGQLNSEARDYLYLAFLLDKDIDGFVNCLVKDSVSTDSLPKHYREALVLYKHQRIEPKIDFSTPEMQADYMDFEAMRKKNPVKVLRENALRASYGNTYWYYYYKE